MARTRPFKRAGPPTVSRDSNTNTQSLKVSGNVAGKKRKALARLTNDNAATAARSQDTEEDIIQANKKSTLNSYQYTGKVDYIDERDAHDILSATPFVQEMYAYYRQEERCARRGFLESSQRHVTQTMRSIVIDWIIRVHCKLRLIPETLYLAVNMFDRYLEQNVISSSNELKLLGAAALLISSKYEEVYYLDLHGLVAECGGVCTRNEILNMETTLLKALEHRITVPTAYTFILRALKAAHANKKMIQCSLYLLDGTLQGYDLITRYLPSQLAAATVFIARNHIGRNTWSPTLLKYTDYCQEEIAPVARAILAHKETMSKELMAVNQKYGSTRYGEVSNTIFICDF